MPRRWGLDLRARSLWNLGWLVFLVLPTACGDEPEPTPEPDHRPLIEWIRDVEFTRTPDGPLHLDLYRNRRPGPAPQPVVIFLHGGGWSEGDKRDARRVGAHLLVRRGYAVVSPTYRLSGTALFPAQIRDAKSAVRWVKEHGSDFGLDPDRIAVWGLSAGGHLAALVGTSAGAAFEEPGVPVDHYRVRAVVDYYGPTDMLQADAHMRSGLRFEEPNSFAARLFGGPIREHPERVARANPITWVTPDDPPFLLVHGDQDPIVPHHQSVLLDQALRAAGVPSTLHTVAGGGHGDPPFWTPAMRDRLQAFLDTHL